MLIQGVAGIQSVPAGQAANLRLGLNGELVVQELHGRYYEQTARNNVYGGAIVGQVTTVGLAPTYTGLCLSNPNASPSNLVINKVGYSFLVAFAAAAHVGLMTGFSSTDVTHTTPVTVRSQKFVGAAASNFGKLDSAATLPVAPTVNTIFGSGDTGAITTVPSLGPSLVDLEGSIVLPPGAFCAIYTSTVSGAAAGGFSFSWEEVPVIPN